MNSAMNSAEFDAPLVTSAGNVQNLNKKNFKEAYDEVLAFTGKTFNRFRIMALLFGIDYCLRMNIFVSYAQSFDDSGSTSTIGTIVYCTYLASGAFSLLNGFIADSWRFDYLFCFAALMDVITFWLEATAVSFKMLAVAYIIGGQTMQTIVYGYSSKFLPMIDCKTFQSDWMQLYAIGQLTAPVFGGLIASFTSYRAVFYTSATVSVLLFGVAIIVVAGTQKKLLEKQLSLMPYYREYDSRMKFDNDDNNNNNNDSESESEKLLSNKQFQFPICNALIAREKEGIMIKSANANVNVREISKHVNSTKINMRHLFMTTLIVLDIGLLISGDTALVTWYLTYMNDAFNASVIYSTGNMSVYIATTTMGIYTVKNILKRRLKNEKMLLFIMFIVSQLLRLLIQLYLVPSQDEIITKLYNMGWSSMQHFIDHPNDGKYFFWFYTAILGYGFGIVLICMMLVFIEVMPKNIAGKVAGFKLCLEYGMKGLGALIVGYFWSKSHQWLWYIVGIETCISTSFYVIILASIYLCRCGE